MMAKTTREGHIAGPKLLGRTGQLVASVHKPCLVGGILSFFLHYLWVRAQGKSVWDFWWENGKESMGWVTERKEIWRVWVGVERVQGLCVGLWGACGV